jgi:hypothetical protein
MDWQRKKHTDVDFKYMSKFYQSVRNFNDAALKAIVLHDGLPDNFTQEHTPLDNQITFVRVDLSKYDPLLGINDVRYHLFKEQLELHPEWDVVFITDVSDVVIRQNPCKHVNTLGRDKIYVGIEFEKLKPHPWMLKRYESMGGKYMDWYKRTVKNTDRIYNCGISGGTRGKLGVLVDQMLEVIEDKTMTVWKNRQEVNVNMAALNWILYTKYNVAMDVKSGPPVHSDYKKYQKDRKDVSFIHK